jgi:F-type H+-transporting ATPase subunit gamma
MANLRQIVKRRKAVRNIRKITKTMELIATSRFQKAMKRALDAEAYTRKIAELAADLSLSATTVKHPLLERRETVKNTVLLVICSNRGLCGGYNGSILREANQRIREIHAAGQTLHLDLSGKRAINFFRFQRVPAENTYIQFEDKPRFDEVEQIANRYIGGYIAGEYDQVQVAYMKFLNAARQMPAVETLLPMAQVTKSDTAAKTENIEYEFLPDAQGILEVIVPVSFKIRLFKCFLDAAVSEQIARRVAMKAATENAGDIIKELTRFYNRARQAQITKEISEVIGGAAALE